jgi:hypothetical protein
MTDEIPNKGNATEDFRKMLEAFGKAMSEAFNDPELKDKAKELGNSISNTARTIGGRFQDEDVKNQFKQAGKAAQQFGKSVADYFKTEMRSPDSK